MKPLEDKVAVVAGATRAAGRGIACMLGEAGATVYCTGRSIRGQAATANRKGVYRPETIEETAEMVTAHGGKGIWEQVDHTQPDQVEALFASIEEEQDGQLDILVNDVWGGDPLVDWSDPPFWEHPLENGLLMQERGIHSHPITSRFGAPLITRQKGGLIVELTDGDDLKIRDGCGIYYDLVKISVIRLAHVMSKDLAKFGCSSVAVTPGYMRSEAMLENYGVTEETWRDAIPRIDGWGESECAFGNINMKRQHCFIV